MEYLMFKLHRLDWRVAAAAATAGAALLVAACGGGGDAPPTLAQPTETATSFTQGAISGFGSIIVGGVRYDDSGATVSDEDGAARSRSDLKLGMMVDVDAKALDRTAAQAVALRVRLSREIVGPVGSVDVAASTAQVLGQTVLVTSSTVFDAALPGGLAALTLGTVVEVHGIPDPANARIVATRIEPRADAPAYRLRGRVAALDATAKTFMLGGALISYAGLPAAEVPPGLADGHLVWVLLQTTPQAGAWVATKLRGGLRLPDGQRDAHVEGAITVFTSATDFEINGLKVDASSAAFPDGREGVVLGARVEAEGKLVGGVLVATRVEMAERRHPGARPLELHGEMGNLDATAKTFALRGVTVWFGGSVEYRGGTEADLANGKKVEVHGVLSTDRTRLEARRIGLKP
jgi:hypothetical protein